jgi:RNA polymerase sigma-70 factor, ECF subfamily
MYRRHDKELTLEVAAHTVAETDLIRRTKTGDKAAFEQLYRMHVGRVYGLCLRLTANKGRAEESTQTVFIRVWEIIGSFRGESAFSTWLHRVAVNVVLAERRKERRLETIVAAAGTLDGFEIAEPARFPGNAIDLETAVASLPDRAREVFVLHDIEGYRHEEIADLLGVVAGTSKTHLHRARKILRGVLER